MFCTSCGTAAENQAAFCANCGNRIAGSSAQKRPDQAQEDRGHSGVAQQSPEKNTLSTVALVTGIASVALFEFVVIPLAAVVISSISLGRANSLARSGALKSGKGKSIAGLVLGIIYSLLGFYYLTLW